MLGHKEKGRFVLLNDASKPHMVKIKLTISTNIVLLLFWSSGPLADVVINEIMYHPLSERDEEEYVELFNTGGTDEMMQDLSGWSFTEGISYRFPLGTFLHPGEYLVIAKDPTVSSTSSGKKALGPYDGVLRDSGEKLTLVDDAGRVVDTVTYSDMPSWPVAADGLGSSLECINPYADNAHVSNWRASATETSLGTSGTPGYRNSVYSNDIPPFITRIFHTPLQPKSTDDILITAMIQDNGEVVSATAIYRINDGKWLERALNDAGVNRDQIRNDGIFSAVIPSAPSKSIIRYKIQAQDDTGQVSDYPLPGEPTPNLGVFVYDGEIASKLPIYWIFLDNLAYKKLLSNPQNNNFQRGTFACNGRVYDNIGIRFRGQWARSWPKKSWKLRFNKDNYFNRRRTVNLNSCYHDRAYIREYLCYRFYREAGCKACQAEFAHVRLNGEFYGIEVDVEQVNEQFLARYGFDPDGNLYKSKQGGDLRRLPSEQAFKGPYEKKTNEGEDWSDLKALADGLATTPASRMHDFLMQNVDVDDILRYWAATTIIQNWDAIIKNHYLFHDTHGTGKWFMFPWDLDRTWGEYASWDLGARIHILAGMEAHPPGFGLPSDWWNRLIDAMLKQPDMLDQYYSHIRNLLAELFTEEQMNQWIDSQRELIEDEVPLDIQKWGTQGHWQSFSQEIRNCKNFVRDRPNFLSASLPTAVEMWRDITGVDPCFLGGEGPPWQGHGSSAGDGVDLSDDEAVPRQAQAVRRGCIPISVTRD